MMQQQDQLSRREALGRMGRWGAIAAAGSSVSGLIPWNATARAAQDARAQPPGRRPNFVFIMTDDHAAHAMSAYGGERLIRTPNLDRIGREGIKFNNAFVTNSLCGPSRATLLTGKYAHLHGFKTNDGQFDGSQQTFPKLLQKAGYQTAMIGKWHLGSDPTGFDYWNILPGQGRYRDPDFIEMGQRARREGYVTDVITDVAIEWLEKRRDGARPFCLFYHHKAPHREWRPDEKHVAAFRARKLPLSATWNDDYATRGTAAREQDMEVRKMGKTDLKENPPEGLSGAALDEWKYQRYMQDYLATVASVDENVGRFLEHLDKVGLSENTIVVYTSDNGMFLGDHGWFDKRFMYEPSLRVPLVVRYPAKIKPGSETDAFALNIDFAATFLDYAGVPIPPDVQGRSLRPILENAGKAPPGWRESMYYHYYEFPQPHHVYPHFGVRTMRHKLIHFYTLKEWELYDLEKDSDELNNVYDDPAYAEVRAQLEAELKRLQAQYGDEGPHEDPVVVAQRELQERARKVKLEQVFRLEAPADAAKVAQPIDPSAKPITVGAHVTPQQGDGVIVAHGGEWLGFVLYIRDGMPRFAVRSEGELKEVVAKEKLPMNEPAHVAAVLDADAKMTLYVDGKAVATAPGQFVARRPATGLSIGSDDDSLVGEYEDPMPVKGDLRDIRLYWGALDAKSLSDWAAK